MVPFTTPERHKNAIAEVEDARLVEMIAARREACEHARERDAVDVLQHEREPSVILDEVVEPHDRGMREPCIRERLASEARIAERGVVRRDLEEEPLQHDGALEAERPARDSEHHL